MRGIASSWVLGLLVSFSANLASANESGPWDGRIYMVKLTLDGKQPETDQLVFMGGKFVSTSSRKYGFAPVTYVVSGSTFSAQGESASDGKTSWKGIIKDTQGDYIEGQLVWVKQGEVTGTYTYNFTGKRRK